MTHNAYIYCRCASCQQSEPLPETIKEQDRICRQYAEKENLHIVGTVSDIGVSGLSETREGFDHLLTLLRDIPNLRVIISSGDRLARGLDAYICLKQKIEKVGASLVVVNEVASQST
jgi:DNA invertase Pin-like site-specific DNA recombinase